MLDLDTPVRRRRLQAALDFRHMEKRMNWKNHLFLSRHIALVLMLATAAALAQPSAVWADGPLTVTATLPLGTAANDVIIDGTLAYVATDKGMTIVDISDPLHPFARGSVVATKGGYCLGLAKKGSFVYLAAGYGGMQVIDVSNPDAPVTLFNAIKAGRVFDVAIHPTANAAYAVTYNGELYVWDISPVYNPTPAAPVWKQTLGVIRWGVGACQTCITRMTNLVTDGQSYLTGVTTSGNAVVTADWGYGGLYSWDSTNPLHLVFRGTFRFKNSMSRMEIDPGHPTSLTPDPLHPKDRAVVYVLLTYGGVDSGVLALPLYKFYSSNLADPVVVTYGAHSNTPLIDPTVCTDCSQFVANAPMDGGGIGFSPNHKYAFYVGGRGNGQVRILNVEDPDHVFPVAMTSVTTTPVGPMNLRAGKEAGIVAYGDYLVLAAGSVGLKIYNFPGLSTP